MFLFNYSFDDILSFTFEFSKTENLFSDGFYGCCVVMCTLCTFIFLIWLREQIIRVGAPDWLERPLNLPLFQALFRARENDNNANLVEAPGNELANNNNVDNAEDNEANDADDENGTLVFMLDYIADHRMLNLADVETDGEGEPDADEQNDNQNEADQPNQAAGNQVAVAQDWNPVIEWDRGADEITWQRVFIYYFNLMTVQYFQCHIYWI